MVQKNLWFWFFYFQLPNKLPRSLQTSTVSGSYYSKYYYKGGEKVTHQQYQLSETKKCTITSPTINSSELTLLLFWCTAVQNIL